MSGGPVMGTAPFVPVVAGVTDESASDHEGVRRCRAWPAAPVHDRARTSAADPRPVRRRSGRAWLGCGQGHAGTRRGLPGFVRAVACRLDLLAVAVPGPGGDRRGGLV